MTKLSNPNSCHPHHRGISLTNTESYTHLLQNLDFLTDLLESPSTWFQNSTFSRPRSSRGNGRVVIYISRESVRRQCYDTDKINLFVEKSRYPYKMYLSLTLRHRVRLDFVLPRRRNFYVSRTTQGLSDKYKRGFSVRVPSSVSTRIKPPIHPFLKEKRFREVYVVPTNCRPSIDFCKEPLES